MKKKRYIPIWISLIFLLSVLIACSTDQEIEDFIVLPEGSPIEVTFGSFTNEINPIATRSNELEKIITNLRLLVFDESGNFLYSREAVLKATEAAPKEKQLYLPDGEKEGIEMVYTYSARLLSSTKKRFIHFIANHDWTNYPQDYLLEGESEGQLIPSLTTDKTGYWRRIELDGLDTNSLQGKVVKLLRNRAKISIEYTEADHNISNAWVYNAHKKGTVAPFIFNKDLSYLFPMQPEIPTIPINAKDQNINFSRIEDNTYEVELFEHSNEGVSPLFVIIEVGESNFYKIDLKKIDAATGITSLYNIVRNYWYKIKIKSITGEGYKSAEEAAKNPAGNNLLASVELEKYPSISNGKHSLSVGCIEAIYTKLPDTQSPAVFKTTINYSEGAENVKVFGLWEQDITDEYLEEDGIDYVIAGSPGGEQKEGELTIKFKKIPENEIIKLQVAVVARPKEGSTEIITRTITITLRPPYQFNAKLESKGTQAKAQVFISFDVPKTLPVSLFPFEVFIKTKELTPVAIPGMNYVFKDSEIYVKYLITEKDREGGGVEFMLNRNVSGATEKIKLISDYYKTEEVNL